MSTTTVRISPPKPSKRRKAKSAAPDPFGDLGRFFRRYRVFLIPYGAALWTALGTAYFVKSPRAYLVYAIGVLVCTAIIWFRGHVFFGAIRPVERAYAYTVPCVAALWATYATVTERSVSGHDLAVLFLVASLTASPWWRHRRNRGSVVVKFENLPRAIRDQRLKETKKLTLGWSAFVSAGRIQSAKLQRIEFNQWSVGIAVRLRNGMHAGELQRSSKRSFLESASLWPVAPGSVRVYPDMKDTRNCTVMYMLKDPHAEPIEPDENETPTPESLVIGIFETGADVLFLLVNTLIAGITGSGKSILVNRIIQLLAKVPTIGLLGADLTPGATELGPWKGVFHELANTPAQLNTLFDQVINEMERRGLIMERNGWKTFRCTERDPYMVLVIDEAQRVKEFGMNKKLSHICADIRKYGGCVILATQYPTAPNLPKEITTNLPQKIGMKVDGDTADRVIFGSSATKTGWSPSLLIPEGREGSFLIRSKNYNRPILARGHYVTEEMVERDNVRWGPHRTSFGSISLRPVTTAAPLEALEEGTVATMEREENADIVDAVIVDDSEATILDLIDRGIARPIEIRQALEEYGQKITVRTVNRMLKSMKERGVIYQLRAQGPWHRK